MLLGAFNHITARIGYWQLRSGERLHLIFLISTMVCLPWMIEAYEASLFSLYSLLSTGLFFVFVGLTLNTMFSRGLFLGKHNAELLTLFTSQSRSELFFYDKFISAFEGSYFINLEALNQNKENTLLHEKLSPNKTAERLDILLEKMKYKPFSLALLNFKSTSYPLFEQYGEQMSLIFENASKNQYELTPDVDHPENLLSFNARSKMNLLKVRLFEQAQTLFRSAYLIDLKALPQPINLLTLNDLIIISSTKDPEYKYNFEDNVKNTLCYYASHIEDKTFSVLLTEHADVFMPLIKEPYDIYLYCHYTNSTPLSLLQSPYFPDSAKELALKLLVKG